MSNSVAAHAAVRKSTWLAAVLIVGATGANASTLEFDFNAEFSGGQAPGGVAPWITATITDITSGAHAGSVELTISTANLLSNENVSEADFNILPSLNSQLSNLVFTPVSGVAASAINTGVDAFKADGDGKYDIQFMYPGGSGFDKQLTSSYYISDPGSVLTVADFDTLSAPMGGHGPFLTAAHIQNTTGACGSSGCTGSGWVAPVPLPAAAWLLLSGLGGLAAFARRTRHHA